jgi:hypothetical protein
LPPREETVHFWIDVTRGRGVVIATLATSAALLGQVLQHSALSGAATAPNCSNPQPLQCLQIDSSVSPIGTSTTLQLLNVDGGANPWQMIVWPNSVPSQPPTNEQFSFNQVDNNGSFQIIPESDPGDCISDSDPWYGGGVNWLGVAACSDTPSQMWYLEPVAEYNGQAFYCMVRSVQNPSECLNNDGNPSPGSLPAEDLSSGSPVIPYTCASGDANSIWDIMFTPRTGSYAQLNDLAGTYGITLCDATPTYCSWTTTPASHPRQRRRHRYA